MLPCLCVTRKVYKFVGVNVTHQDFIKRYSRLGPRELTSPPRTDGPEMEAMTCDKLAHCLLLRTSHDPNSRTKFEVGKTKIFIRCAEREYAVVVPAFVVHTRVVCFGGMLDVCLRPVCIEAFL